MSIWRSLGIGTALVAGLALLFGCDESATTGPKLAPLASTVAAASVSAGHIFIVTEENTNASSVTTSSMPYLMGLAAANGMATQYYANTHPSIGNYFELATAQVLTNDDGSSTIQTVDNVVRELLKAGKTWKSYAEDLPSVGYTGGDVGNYARKHNVFALLSDVVNSAAQSGNLVPFSQFASDLKNNTLPNFSNIVPNLCNDAHDCSLGTADGWLKTNIAPLLASPAFQAGGDGVLIVTFDESASDNTLGGGRVAWVVVSPQAKHGYSSSTTYQHPSTLRLILSSLGVSTFPGAAANAPAMDEFFGSTVVTPPPLPVGTYFSTNFADGTTGPLDVYTNGGTGTCTKSTAYHDAGSAYGMACTVTQSTGEAALQAWFGNGKLGSTPKDPSLNQDLFEETRFVLAPGALKAIGGTTCTVAGAQFKTHKSVYGQVGSNVNGWVMSELGPCSDPSSGKMFTEAELWGTNGTLSLWPAVLQEGVVYDVVYRYHRYTSQNCGTVAVWVNGTKIEDSPCASYLGATNGSTDGLLFWDGATYLQNGVSPLTVYTLFAAAATTPLGAGVASGGTSTPPPPTTGTCQTSAAAWWGTALSAPQTGSFTAEFDATPSGSGVDGVIGLGPKIASTYTDMAAIVRYNVGNTIDARNGGSYTAASSIPYTAGTSYHFRLVVSLGTHTYAAYVRPAGGTELTIGTNYAFRTEQASVTTLADWSLESDYTSTLKVCNMAITTGTTTPPPTVAPVATVTVSPSSASLTVGQTAQLTATDKDASGNTLTGRTVTWTSSNAGSASVTSAGLVTALAAGSTTITATSETVRGTAAVSITAPVATGSCGNLSGATCYYVAPTGNDANAGTQSAPFRTLQHAAGVVNPGDGVLVGAGVYTGSSTAVVTISRSGSSSAWITFQGQPGAIVDGMNNTSSSGIAIRGNYIRVQGFEVRGSERGGIDFYNGSSLPHDALVAHNYIHAIGKECTDDTGGRVGVNAYGNNLTIDGNLIVDIGRFAPGENGCNPSSTAYQNHDHGVYTAQGDHVLIKNNVFRKCVRGWPIQRYDGGGATQNDVQILNNTFFDANPWKPGHIILGGKTTGLVISNNIFSNPTTAGIWWDASDGGTWSGAVVQNNLSTNAIDYGASVAGSGNQTNTAPQFVSSSDAHLASGSPGIDSGVSLLNVLFDFDGVSRPKGAGYDKGAYER